MMNIISKSLNKVYLVIGLLASTIGSTLAHPGHGLTGKNNEGVEHFVSDPYHLFWVLTLTAVLFYAAIRVRKIRSRSSR